MKTARALLWLAPIISALLLLSGCKSGKAEELVGAWKTELYGSEQEIEFTPDGYFFDHTSGFVNRYRTSGDNIITYVDGEKDSEISLPYSIKGDVLVYGKAEYTRIDENNK